MKHRKAVVTLTSAVLILAACSASGAAPKCSDQKVLDALSRVTLDNFVDKAAKQRAVLKQLQTAPGKLAEYDAEVAKMLAVVKSAKHTYTNIVMKNTNEKTGAHSCAATEELIITADGQTISEKTDFTYTVEKTDDGKNFIVTTQGLVQ